VWWKSINILNIKFACLRRLFEHSFNLVHFLVTDMTHGSVTTCQYTEWTPEVLTWYSLLITDMTHRSITTCHVTKMINTVSHYVYRHSLLYIDVTYTGWSKSHATDIKIFIGGCISIQFDWINKNTISLWLYKSPRRSRHVVTCSRQSSVVFQQSKCKDVFFTSATSVHCRTLPGISFLLDLPEWV
jgi:hypothetical protein